MRELNLEEFPDELCQVKFSFDEACEQVGSQTLIKELAKDPIIEKSKLRFDDKLRKKIVNVLKYYQTSNNKAGELIRLLENDISISF